MINLRVDTSKPHHWKKISKEPPILCTALAGEVEAEFAVVGGGNTGLVAGLTLAEAGHSVVLLEADEIAEGASGRNNGLVLSHHSKASPREIVAQLGPVRGARYNALVQNGAAVAFNLMRKYAIQCDAIETGWIQPAHSEAALARVKVFQQEWSALGVTTEWLDRKAVADRLGSPRYRGGWWTASAGHINPFAYATGLARAARAAGVQLFTRSPVRSLLPDAGNWRVTTPGGQVKASRVLIATNALTGAFWPGLAKTLIPVKVYQTATAPVSSNLRGHVIPGNEAVSDTQKDIGAFHYDARGGLIIGGTHTHWANAEARGLDAIALKARHFFPELGEIRVEEYWEGVLGVTLDRLPRLTRLAPGLIFAGVYSGRGVALSSNLGAIAARWLSDQMTDDDLPVEAGEMQPIPFHAIAKVMAQTVHPWHRLQDRFA
jgi:glycine/D-amino acid oxidase-like deaminating enzyme